MSTSPQSGADFVDFYEVVGVPPDADEATIADKIKEQQRAWRTRTALGDLGRRQEAERHIADLAEARRMLLDSRRRADYDRRRRNAPSGGEGTGAATAGPASGYDPLQRAEEALTRNDYRQGAFFAEEAARTSNSAEAWNLRARAYSGLGEGQRAVVAAQEAVALDPDNPLFHIDLGQAHLTLGEPRSAAEAFQNAVPLADDEVVPLGLAAEANILDGRYAQAVNLLQDLRARHGGDVRVKDALAEALVMHAESIPADTSDDDTRYAITSAEEIDRMSRLLDQAEQAGARDPDVRSAITHARAAVKRAAGRTLDLNVGRRAMVRHGPGMGCFIGILLALPFVIIIAVVGMMADGVLEAGRGFLTLLVAVGMLAVWWPVLVVPRWKQFRRDAKLRREIVEGIV